MSLITGCIKGNQIAQKTLFDSFSPKFFALCLRYMKSTDDAEDVLQEGMVKIFTKLPEYKGKGSFEGWMRRIVVNTCLDQIRKNQKLKFDVSIDKEEYKLSMNAHILENMSANELIEEIKKMPPGYRVVFNMFAIEGYSHQEIAEKLGVKESTSKSQYLRARAYLKERISKQDD
ncbi:MAG: RNA polymerase sigma factor [Crocinitomicaceae bacterium]|nr:RNA polymerase sigma factor [Crocinitomicaceae bacterium]